MLWETSHLIPFCTRVGSQAPIMSGQLDAWRPPRKGVVDQNCRQAPSHRWGGGARLHPAAAARQWGAQGVSIQRPVSLETWVKCDLVRHSFSTFLGLCSPPPPSLFTPCQHGPGTKGPSPSFLAEPFCSELRSFSPVRAAVT